MDNTNEQLLATIPRDILIKNMIKMLDNVESFAWKVYMIKEIRDLYHTYHVL